MKLKKLILPKQVSITSEYQSSSAIDSGSNYILTIPVTISKANDNDSEYKASYSKIFDANTSRNSSKEHCPSSPVNNHDGQAANSLFPPAQDSNLLAPPQQASNTSEPQSPTAVDNDGDDKNNSPTLIQPQPSMRQGCEDKEYDVTKSDHKNDSIEATDLYRNSLRQSFRAFETQILSPAVINDDANTVVRNISVQSALRVPQQ